MNAHDPNKPCTPVSPIVPSLAKTLPFLLAAVSLLLISVGCQRGTQDPQANAGKSNQLELADGNQFPRKMTSEHLPNLVRLHDKVISGGTPQDEATFRELKTLGVKSIISVDGAEPNLELAEQFGMRYVHLPHGYDGIEPGRARELAKAITELDGPVYVHCHHGKHRSPTAAAVGCVGAGLISLEQGIATLKIAGTSPDYLGLHESASHAEKFDRELLEALPVEFRSKAPLTKTTELMVKLEHVFDRLKALSENNWQPLSNHPDLSSAHEALILREHFTELIRFQADDESLNERYNEMMTESQSAAKALEDGLKSLDGSKPSQVIEIQASLKEQLKRIGDNCKACHKSFRDNPE